MLTLSHFFCCFYVQVRWPRTDDLTSLNEGISIKMSALCQRHKRGNSATRVGPTKICGESPPCLDGISCTRFKYLLLCRLQPLLLLQIDEYELSDPIPLLSCILHLHVYPYLAAGNGFSCQVSSLVHISHVRAFPSKNLYIAIHHCYIFLSC